MNHSLLGWILLVSAREKPLHWVGSAKRDYLDFPLDVQTHMGYALSVAQLGGKHPSAKPWKGDGSGPIEGCSRALRAALPEVWRHVMSRIRATAITAGTTNVFEDLGLPDAAELQTKARLAMAVNELIKARGLKQREAADVLGIPQPKVSALKNYRLDQFSVEKLMELLTALNHDVEIMIRPCVSAGVGHIAVLTVL